MQLKVVPAVPSIPQLESITESSWSPSIRCKTEGVKQAQNSLQKANYYRSARELTVTVSFSVSG